MGKGFKFFTTKVLKARGKGEEVLLHVEKENSFVFYSLVCYY
jgi:hypothetical protein